LDHEASGQDLQRSGVFDKPIKNNTFNKKITKDEFKNVISGDGENRDRKTIQAITSYLR
jgi:hypothetical protein